MQYRADLRTRLDRQINLLSEKEVTKTPQLLRLICNNLEISLSADGDLEEMAFITSVDRLAERVGTELQPGG